MDSTASQGKGKTWARREGDQPPHSPRLLLMRSTACSGTKCLNQIKSGSVSKAFLSLRRLENLPKLSEEPNGSLTPCVPGKEQSSQSRGFLLVSLASETLGWGKGME